MKIKKLILLIIFLCLFVFSGINVCAEQINIQKLNFELGVKSLKQNELNEAIKYFKLVLDKDPNNVEAHYNIAVAYKKLGNNTESLKQFNKVVELLNTPQKNSVGVMNAADLRRQNQKLHDKGEGALEDFDVYTQVKAKENDYIDLGDMHTDNNRYKTAIEYYNLALQINPYNDNTYFKVSRCYMHLNDYLNAEPYIKRAIELDPNNSRYKYFQNKVAAKLKLKYGDKIRKEEIVLKNFNKKDPLADFEQKNYKRELVNENWTDKGSSKGNNSIDSAFNENTHKKDNYKAKIDAYYQDKDKRQALYKLSHEGYNDFAYKQSQESDYLDLGDLHFDNQEYDTAIEYYKMAKNINPNNDYTYYKLSRAYLALEKYKTANNYIEKALSLSGKNTKYVYFKNQITDKLAKNEASSKEEFYSPPEEPGQNGVNVDHIAQEPGEFTPKEILSLADRLKSAVLAVRMPHISLKMPDFSKISEKVKNPLEGKVEKFSDRRKEHQEKIAGNSEETVFNRPADYYEIKGKHPDSDYTHTKIDENGFQMPINPPERHRKLYTASYYNKKGIEFFKRNNLDQAEDYFKKSVQLKPMYAQGYVNLANVEDKRGNLEKAQEYALKAVEIDPEFPEGYYNLALINKKQGNIDQEIYYLNKAIAADPKYYEAYFTRGLAYYRKGDYEKAKYNFGQVLMLKNDHYLASQNLGIVYANELKYGQAEKYLNLAIKLNKNNPRSYFHLGVVQQNSGKFVSAIENFQKSIELDPVNYRAYISLSKCYEQNNEPEKALEVLKLAAEKNSKNAELYNYLGLLDIKLDKYEDASIAFKEAVEKNPKRPIYHYNLSQSYLTMSKRKASNYEFQRAVDIIPSSVQDYTDLADIFLDRGMASYAIQVLKEGIANLPKNDYLFLVLSDFYERTGAVKTAKEVLKQYLDKNTGEKTFSILVRRRLNQLENL